MASVEPHPDGFAFGQIHDLVVYGAGPPPANLDQQTRHEFQIVGNRSEIHATLETMTGFSAELITPGVTPNGFGTPESGLNVDIGRLQSNRRLRPAHEPRHTFGHDIGMDHTYFGIPASGHSVAQFLH